MLMNTLEIKHVADLLTISFSIPSYQRGYRKNHIDALLRIYCVRFAQNGRNAE